MGLDAHQPPDGLLNTVLHMVEITFKVFRDAADWDGRRVSWVMLSCAQGSSGALATRPLGPFFSE